MCYINTVGNPPARFYAWAGDGPKTFHHQSQEGGLAMSMLKKFSTGLAIIGAALSIVACGAKMDPNAGQKPSDPITVAQTVSAPSLVAVPVTRTETETMNCVAAGLKADGRTAAQATNLAAITTQVTIDGEKLALPEGGSYYSLCKGATPEQQLVATKTNLDRMTAAYNAANVEIRQTQPWVYRDVNNPQVRENTWNFYAVQNETRLEAAVTWDLFTAIMLIVLFAAFIGAAFRNSIGRWFDRRLTDAPAARK
jgi:hypothetical protein